MRVPYDEISPLRPHELVAETTTPDGTRMTLSTHAGDYYIEVDGQVLMSTRAPGSERALAEIAAEQLAGQDSPRVLIGGLGLGFTMGASLDALPRGARVVVAEYFAVIVDWNRKFGFESAQDRFADPRLTVEVGDVVDYLGRVSRPFDAILLDVDNGPDAWCLASNRRLYDPPGLQRIKQALVPGGLLAVWSSEGSAVFERRLGAAGFEASSRVVRSRGMKGERHTIFLAVSPKSALDPPPNRRGTS